MDIKTSGDHPANLFHAVNESWKGDRMVFSFSPSHTADATMIADGLLPYLRFHHGDEVLEFFTPDACLEKEDWKWDDEQKCVVNPLGEDLAALEDIDGDYDFSTYGGPIEDTEGNAEGVPTAAAMEGSIPLAATALAQTHLDRVAMGIDDDSVSTLGTGAGSRFVPRSIGVTIGQTLRHQNMHSPQSEVSLSGRSTSTMETLNSRVSQIETNIQQMEKNISASMEKSMETLLSKFFQNKGEQQPEKAMPTGGAPGSDT